MVAYACNLSIWEAKTEILRVWVQLELHSKTVSQTNKQTSKNKEMLLILA